MEQKSEGMLSMRVVAPCLLVMVVLAGLGAALAGKPEPNTGRTTKLPTPVQAESRRAEHSAGASAQPTEAPESDGTVYMYN